MKDVKTLLLELVSVPSISESPTEGDMAHKVLELVREDPYFADHPDHCGLWDGGDRLGRKVAWALKKGSGPRTVLFSGHYDTVDYKSYGAFAPLALQPGALRAAMLENPPDDAGIRRDLHNPNWMFGRGCADMKAGLALNINALYGYQPGDINVLITAVSDEENLSAGARQAVGLYEELAERFGLEYVIAIESEPSNRDADGDSPHEFIHGAAGKILPVVVAKGIPAHSSNMLSGVNSAHLMARIIQNTEYDCAFVDRGGDVFTEPPAVQLVRDMKQGYDVSMPEYTACAFNMIFFEADPMAMMARLLENCRAAARDLLTAYNACMDSMVAAGQIDSTRRKGFDIPVCSLMELELRLQEKPGFEAFRAEARACSARLVESGETMQWASICYIRDMMAFSGNAGPMVVAGIAPPYYPAIHTDMLSKSIDPIIAHAAAALGEKSIRTRRLEYSQAMMDLSYKSCPGPESAAQVMENIPLPRTLYDMDVAAMARINIPTLVVGPARKEIHQIGERVYLPDVTDTLPVIFQQVIDSVAAVV